MSDLFCVRGQLTLRSAPNEPLIPPLPGNADVRVTEGIARNPTAPTTRIRQSPPPTPRTRRRY